MFRASAFAAVIVLALAACSKDDGPDGARAPATLEVGGQAIALRGIVHVQVNESIHPLTLVWATDVPSFCDMYAARPCVYSARPPAGVHLIAYGAVGAGATYDLSSSGYLTVARPESNLDTQAISGTVTLTPITGSLEQLDVSVDATFPSGRAQQRFVSTLCPALETAPSTESTVTRTATSYDEYTYCDTQIAERSCTLVSGVWSCTCTASDRSVTTCVAAGDPNAPGTPLADCCPNGFH